MSLPRAISLLLFAAVCALMTHWALELSSSPASVPPPPVEPGQADISRDGTRIAELFFTSGTQAAGRDIRLVGVAASRRPGEGSAVLLVDGKQQRSVRSGALIAEGVVLKEVHPRSVLIERGGAAEELKLPEKKPVIGVSNQR